MCIFESVQPSTANGPRGPNGPCATSTAALEELQLDPESVAIRNHSLEEETARGITSTRRPALGHHAVSLDLLTC